MRRFHRFAVLSSLAMLALAPIVSVGSALAQSQPQTNKAPEPANSGAQREKRQQDGPASDDKTQVGTSKQEKPKQEKPKQDKAKGDPKIEPKDQRELEEEEDI